MPKTCEAMRGCAATFACFFGVNPPSRLPCAWIYGNIHICLCPH